MVTHLASLTALTVFGAKTQEFLQGQLTCDIRTLTAWGDYSLMACCDHRGKMLANGWIMRWRDDFILIISTSLAETLIQRLQKYAAFSKVTVVHHDRFFITEFIGDTQSAAAHQDNLTKKIVLPGKDRYLLIFEKNSATEITKNVDETQWRKNNIENELAILCDKTSLLFTPAMIHFDQLGGVSFNKGCYVGQEIVARAQYLGKTKRHLCRLTKFSAARLEPGDIVKNDNPATTGIIVDVVNSAEQQFDILAVM